MLVGFFFVFFGVVVNVSEKGYFTALNEFPKFDLQERVAVITYGRKGL